MFTAQKHDPAATEQILFKSVVDLNKYKFESLNPTTTHSFVAALQISKALNPTTTHSFMAALHISMSLLIPSGLNSHVDIQISIELKQQNR